MQNKVKTYQAFTLKARFTASCLIVLLSRCPDDVFLYNPPTSNPLCCCHLGCHVTWTSRVGKARNQTDPGYCVYWEPSSVGKNQSSFRGSHLALICFNLKAVITKSPGSVVSNHQPSTAVLYSWFEAFVRMFYRVCFVWHVWIGVVQTSHLFKSPQLGDICKSSLKKRRRRKKMFGHTCYSY